jgi:hypothetical protein
MTSCPDPSIFAGMTKVALQTALSNAQAAYVALSTGTRGESFSYAQGDGSKSVTYTRANIGQLSALIRMLQQELGIVRRARMPTRFIFT